MTLLLEGDSYGNIEQKIYNCTVRVNLPGCPELARIHTITRLADIGLSSLPAMYNIYAVLEDISAGGRLMAVTCLPKEAYVKWAFGKNPSEESKVKAAWAKVLAYKEKMTISIKEGYACPVADVPNLNDVLSAFLPTSKYVNLPTSSIFYARKSPRRWERSFKNGITHERYSSFEDETQEFLVASVTKLPAASLDAERLCNPHKYYVAPRQAVQEILAKQRQSVAINENYAVGLFPYGNKWEAPNFHLRVLYQGTCIGLVVPDERFPPAVKLFPQALAFNDELEEAGFFVIQ